ncbi:efflux RND transporter periplasmic adaptor subunit [Rhodopseudomonas sp. WA056]|uniref:efflux RND transporter periplasmic adaptor subunit n=1 Tax=Rhodopseudomonas sp. WA056 TaxID=2269367 RepID=UPI0013E09DD9|nr:efflux RND transporter periplasmic adaptor subunit [Rhodopseudomonas sp. WA056]NEW86444.1 efflux RND transporter periplasmic adaptor subunit [Rhodopseudomonas sp. WA056]
MTVTTKTIAALRAACAFGMLVGLAGCGEDKQAGAAEKQAPPVVVSVVTVAPETLRIVSDLPGRIAPTRIAEVRPRVSGIIIERVFQQGTIVKQGDVLYRLDPAPFQVRVASAKAALQRAVATRTLAAQQAERQTRLRDRDVTTGQLYDKAVAELAQAEADEASARAGLQTAELDLQYTEVRAPITGRIGRALITEGALFTVGGSESLATIQQLDPVYADFTQSANEMLALKHAAQRTAKPGDAIEAEVRLRFDNGTNYAHRGRLLFSEASVDATTGQVTLRGEFPNPDGDLLPGMYVRVQLVQGEEAGVLAVPDRALRRDPGGQAQLYVVTADRRAELRPVTPTRLVDGRWIIASGLKAGDAVIVQGFQALSPGASVDPKPWSGIAAAGTASASRAK